MSSFDSELNSASNRIGLILINRSIRHPFNLTRLEIFFWLSKEIIESKISSIFSSTRRLVALNYVITIKSRVRRRKTISYYHPIFNILHDCSRKSRWFHRKNLCIADASVHIIYTRDSVLHMRDNSVNYSITHQYGDLLREDFDATVLTRKGHLNLCGTFALTESHSCCFRMKLLILQQYTL
ncbi:unnamed protein product [Adineta ricciae]|uniref:Uncharacterized protein n=1 Tax=Adineta ricciae TaxID=249248 RepID=A0A815VNC1_ADIRI|nr:unnamed protein product [Adineta ricciae]